MLETSQAFVLFKLFITLLLPTFGQPINPTVTALFEPQTFESCLINCTRFQAPIALEEWIKVSAIFELSAIDFLQRWQVDKWVPCDCKLALNIITGNSLLKQVCHACAFQMGTRSILLRIKIIFLSGWANIFLQIYLHLQDKGSLASSTSSMISQFQIIFFISLQYLPCSWKFLDCIISQPYYSLDRLSQNYLSSIRCSILGTFSFYKF